MKNDTKKSKIIGTSHMKHEKTRWTGQMEQVDTSVYLNIILNSKCEYTGQIIMNKKVC